MPTLVLHLDMDTFFVSVERLRDQKLNGVPVIVGGSPTRGVVSSCSYEARPYGVRSGMAMRQALRLCPQARVIHHDYANYSAYALQVRAIIQAHVPRVEFASIDECYCDFSGFGRFQDGWSLAQQLRRAIQQQTGLPLSMCLAGTKTTAKIGTGQAKPNGELCIPPGAEASFLAPLPLRKIPGLGPKSAQQLAQMGLTTIGDLQKLEAAAVEKCFGAWGTILWRKARGLHVSPLHDTWRRKQIGKETTFNTNQHDIPVLRATLSRLCEQVGYRLRKDGRQATSLTLKLRYHDFETHTYCCQLPATHQDTELRKAAIRLFARRYRAGRALRLVGITVSGLLNSGSQLGLFEDQARKNRVLKAKDAVNTHLGKLMVKTAASLVPPKP